MKVKDYKIILSSCIANIFEWYDYTLFILFAVAIADNFFPKGDQSVVLIKAFLIFAIGYIVRPLGGIFFGIIGDRFGRKEAVAISTICIALPTTLIGLLPTYQSIGISATISISVIRMLQGLSVGGSLSSSMSFLTEHSGNNNRGLISSLLMSSISIGILLGIVVSSTVQSMTTQAEFNNWGWRIPFLLGSPVILVGIYIKYKLQETPVFQSIKKAGKISQTPLKTVITKYWKEILISIAINATSSIMFYFVAAYLVNYLKFNREFDSASVDQLNKYCCLAMACASCLSGWMYDKIGAYKTYITIILLIIIATCTLVPLIAKADFNTVTYAQVILSILAALYIGSEPALYAALYPDHVRNTALSLSYNISVSIFGGTAPFIFAYLTQYNNSFNYCVYYIVIWALISLIGILMYKRVHTTTLIKQ